MADRPSFIGTPKGGEWVITLTNQTATRSGTPPAATLLLTAGSNGAVVESIVCKPLGTNVDSVLLLFLYKPSTQTYHCFGSAALAATTAPSAASDTGMAVVNVTSTLPPILFPAAATDTSKVGFRLAPGAKIYAALDTAVAAGWVVYANGGDC